MFITSPLPHIAVQGLAFSLPHTALAQQVCTDVLARLPPITSVANLPALLSTWQDVEAPTCDASQILAGRTQTSAFIAQVVQDVLDAGGQFGKLGYPRRWVKWRDGHGLARALG